ncbi:MAG: hypothetical protein LBK98_10290, partial [Peptococcaceae bacterium]|nr:hypothetical protein [Peptococcaceae bacterium]
FRHRYEINFTFCLFFFPLAALLILGVPLRVRPRIPALPEKKIPTQNLSTLFRNDALVDGRKF